MRLKKYRLQHYPCLPRRHQTTKNPEDRLDRRGPYLSVERLDSGSLFVCFFNDSRGRFHPIQQCLKKFPVHLCKNGSNRREYHQDSFPSWTGMEWDVLTALFQEKPGVNFFPLIFLQDSVEAGGEYIHMYTGTLPFSHEKTGILFLFQIPGHDIFTLSPANSFRSWQ